MREGITEEEVRLLPVMTEGVTDEEVRIHLVPKRT